MLFESSRYAFCAALEAGFSAIRDEFDSLDRAALRQCPADNVVVPGWKVFELWSFSDHLRVDENCALCPVTAAISAGAPGLRIAGFSVLAPGVEIPWHRGRRDEVRKCHFPLHIPDHERCAIRIGNEVHHWEEGRCLVFGNATPHNAWNRSTGERVVLVVEFVEP